MSHNFLQSEVTLIEHYANADVSNLTKNNIYIMQTCSYNECPLTPHFHIVKLEFTAVYVLSISKKNI